MSGFWWISVGIVTQLQIPSTQLCLLVLCGIWGFVRLVRSKNLIFALTFVAPILWHYEIEAGSTLVGGIIVFAALKLLTLFKVI